MAFHLLQWTTPDGDRNERSQSVNPLAQPRTTIAPLQLPPLWLIALTLLTLAGAVVACVQP